MTTMPNGCVDTGGGGSACCSQHLAARAWQGATQDGGRRGKGRGRAGHSSTPRASLFRPASALALWEAYPIRRTRGGWHPFQRHTPPPPHRAARLRFGGGGRGGLAPRRRRAVPTVAVDTAATAAASAAADGRRAKKKRKTTSAARFFLVRTPRPAGV